MLIDFDTYRWDAQNCIRCTNCKWVDFIWMQSLRFSKLCPSNACYFFDAYAANGRYDIALAMAENRIEYSPRLLEEIYACTLCGACDVKCLRNVGLEPSQVLEWMRQKAVEDGQGPMPEHRAIADNISKNRNRYGSPNENRAKWLPSDIKPAEKADVLYFVGCNSSFKQQQLSRSTARLLQATGTDFMVLGEEEWCCGNPLYSAGLVDQAGEVARHNLDAIEKSGAKTVIASCAECFHTLKVIYPKLMGKSTSDLGFEVLHLTEYMERQLQEGNLKFTTPVNMKVTYQDPCRLGRMSEPWTHWEGIRGKYGIFDPPKPRRKGTNGIYDAPRNILNAVAGLELNEMERKKDQAWCCGAGGGVRDAFRDFALWTARERLDEAAETAGAEAVITACPYCRENFDDAIRGSNEPIQTFDIAEIMLQATGGKI